MRDFFQMVPSSVFPKGIDLLDRMMGYTTTAVPSASEALAELRAIKAELSEEILQFQFVKRWL